MEQHPIPQNVTAYEFHLIGNMTVKQFVELGGGVLLAVIIYGTNLNDVFKWPLIVFFVLVGAALAFLPFDGRPLDRMVLVFIRAVYSPTRFVWRKTPKLPPYFNYKPQTTKADPLNLEKQRLRKNLSEYLDTLPDQPQPSQLDVAEAQHIYDLTRLFDQVSPAPNVSPGSQNVSLPGSPKVRVRRLKSKNDILLQADQVAQTARAASIQIPEIVPVKVGSHLASPAPANQPAATDLPQALPHSKANYAPETSLTTSATTNQQLPFPSLPTQPNLVVGMVLDKNGRIVENAIVEIKDENRMPIRALKSNRLGQFFSATPLKNGRYEIRVEKEGLKYPALSLDLSGQIIPPLEIRSQTPLN